MYEPGIIYQRTSYEFRDMFLAAHRDVRKIRNTVVISEENFTEMRRKVSQRFPGFIDDAATMELFLEQDAKVVKLGSLTITILSGRRQQPVFWRRQVWENTSTSLRAIRTC